jgi:serine/threonine protein kinase
LGDFGCSRKIGEIEPYRQAGGLPPGTPGYQAPELLLPPTPAGGCGVTANADVYSFGVTAWQLRHRHAGAPFGRAHPHQIIYQVVTGLFFQLIFLLI